MFWACAYMGNLFSEYLMKTVREGIQEKNMMGARQTSFMKINSRKGKSSYL